MNDKVLTLLGFASKAGKLSYGMDAVKASLSQKKSKLVLISKDVSPKSSKEAVFFAEKSKIPVFLLGEHNMETVSHAVGRKCGILSVNDKSFSNSLVSVLNSREEI